MSADRWFRRILRVLPPDIRLDYGSEMERVFREQRREAAARDRLQLVRLWFQTLRAVAAVGLREHLIQLRQDIRYAFRTLARERTYALAAILTLGLGIGATTATFGIVHAVLLRPLPYTDPDRLVAVWNRWDGSPVAALSNPEYLDYSEQSRTLWMAAAAGGAVNLAGAAGEPERVNSVAISTNALEVLGTPPAMGRGFRPHDSARGAPPVAILSHGFWQRRFGGDAGIVHRTISVNGLPTAIVGVMPRNAALPYEIRTLTRAEIYLPLSLDANAPRHRRGGHYLHAFARLQPAVTRHTAAAEMSAILAPLIERYPDEHDQGNFGIVVRPLHDDLVGESRPILAVLGGAVLLVLLLACTNVANLQLARGASRQHELAVRAALGASRFRVVRQLLTESAVLSLTGALLGVVVAYWCNTTLPLIGTTTLPRLDRLTLDRSAVLFAAGTGLAATVFFGAIPAFRLSSAGAKHTLNNSTRAGINVGSRTLRQALVACQVAAAVILLIGAGLLIKSFMRLNAVDAGFDAERVLTMRVTLPAATYPGRPEVTSFFTQLLAKVRALPGVQSSGAGSGLPLAAPSGDWSFDIEGRGRAGTRFPGAADWYVVMPGYFETLGIPLNRGRLPQAYDSADSPPIVVINEATERALFSHEDPIGRRIRLSRGSGAEQPWRTIVGVVGDVRSRGLAIPPRPELYIPHEQYVSFSGTQARAMTLAVKTDGAPVALIPSVRAVLRDLDPAVPAAQVSEMAAIVSQSVADRRLNVVLVTAFGLLALILAVVGLFGVVAFNVTQRAREMGLRMALGASRASVLRMVLLNGARMLLFGTAAGIAATLALGPRLATLLYEVQPHDIPVLVCAPAVLLFVGAVASYIPARRATRVDPAIALRGE